MLWRFSVIAFGEHGGVMVRGVATSLSPALALALTLFFKMTSEGGDLSPNASQSHQVLQSAQINGAES